MVLLLIILLPSVIFSQSISDLNFKGQSDRGSIALVVSNQAPIYPELSPLINTLATKGYRVALVSKELEIDNLHRQNSPFVDEVEYVLKISVKNTSTREAVLDIMVDFLSLSSKKFVSTELKMPRANIPLIALEIENLMKQIFPKIPTPKPSGVLTTDDKGGFTFNPQQGLKVGDEIFVSYQKPKGNLSESPAIITKITPETIFAKDLNKQTEIGDKISPVSPKRNRASILLHAMIPTLGSQAVLIPFDGLEFSANSRWVAGFRIIGVYERFLAHQLVSTTAFGISFDGISSTDIFTGIGYRVLHRSWEFQPYLRIGGQYNSLTVAAGSRTLRGIVLRFGINAGINFSYRLTKDLYLGFDMGVIGYPAEYLGLTEATSPVDLQNTEFNLSRLYPYLGIKVGWIF